MISSQTNATSWTILIYSEIELLIAIDYQFYHFSKEILFIEHIMKI